LGCGRASFAVYKNKICRLPPWRSDAVARPKSEPRPDPLRLNMRVLSECAVARPELRIAPADSSINKAPHAYPVVSASHNMLGSVLAGRLGTVRLVRISL
jgi:hypothetical protein